MYIYSISDYYISYIITIYLFNISLDSYIAYS